MRAPYMHTRTASREKEIKKKGGDTKQQKTARDPAEQEGGNIHILM